MVLSDFLIDLLSPFPKDGNKAPCKRGAGGQDPVSLGLLQWPPHSSPCVSPVDL